MQVFFTEDFDKILIVGERFEMTECIAALYRFSSVIYESSDHYEYYVLLYFLDDILSGMNEDVFEDPCLITMPSGIDPQYFDDDDIHETNVFYVTDVDPIILYFGAIGMYKVMPALKADYCKPHGLIKDAFWTGDSLLYATDKAQIDLLLAKVLATLSDIPQLKKQVGSIHEAVVQSRETYKYIDIRLLVNLNQEYVKASKTKRKKNLKTWLDQLIHIDPKYKQKNTVMKVSRYFDALVGQSLKRMEKSVDKELTENPLENNAFKDFAA